MENPDEILHIGEKHVSSKGLINYNQSRKTTSTNNQYNVL